MDVQTLATKAGLPVRKVRYVLDQPVLPGLRGRLQTHLAGRPRSFTEREGYFIGLAALLLEGGVRRRTVIEVMERLANLSWPAVAARAGWPNATQRAVAPPRTALEAAYSWRCESAALLVGDGVNLRLRLGPVDTRWLEPRTLARLSEDYRPLVLIQVDLAQLRVGFLQPGGPRNWPRIRQ
jgi:hypothetical protein